MERDMSTTLPSPDAAAGVNSHHKSAAEVTPTARAPPATTAGGSQSPDDGESPVNVPIFTPVNPPQSASPEALPVAPGLAELEADPRRTHRTWKPRYGRVTKCDPCETLVRAVPAEFCSSAVTNDALFASARVAPGATSGTASAANTSSTRVNVTGR
ncbi:hypothetical protein QBC36DRAFT_307325 [Triangularia setosa]|uniref:Uncharacterized protein n=1 Tax=Triangularia setosa TaxID=2587417 RepID=A0AAN6WF06_9PEZI|nr:hypothetical protein QBC36DRAFT_307325 [Podospora setosa]